jgi:uracil-DNA glycosylase
VKTRSVLPHDAVIPVAELPLETLLEQARACTLCADALPLGPRPVLSAGASARILVVGQAPGTRVHETGIPWNDRSGERLRAWLGVDRDTFYDPDRFAILPMGLCYPGRGRSGDLPPRPECAPRWHPPVLAALPRIRLRLLIGHYAQRHYLEDARGTLSDRVAAWRALLPGTFLLPHPSPRNQRWLRDRPWFEAEVVPALRSRVQEALLEEVQDK